MSLESLTRQERLVLNAWLEGLSLKENARQLGNISARTIETHRANIKNKLQVSNRSDLRAYCQWVQAPST